MAFQVAWESKTYVMNSRCQWVDIQYRSWCFYYILSLFFPECNTLNGLVSEVFIRFFVETIGHYSLFLTQNEKAERVFQREAFRKSVASKSIRRFLEVFMESQMFAGFIQDRELRKCRAKGKACFSTTRQQCYEWMYHNLLLAMETKVLYIMVSSLNSVMSAQ